MKENLLDELKKEANRLNDILDAIHDKNSKEYRIAKELANIASMEFINEAIKELWVKINEERRRRKIIKQISIYIITISSIITMIYFIL